MLSSEAVTLLESSETHIYVNKISEDDTICLDGDFNLEQLEACIEILKDQPLEYSTV